MNQIRAFLIKWLSSLKEFFQPLRIWKSALGSTNNKRMVNETKTKRGFLKRGKSTCFDE